MTISRRQSRIPAALFVLGLAALLVTLSVSQARPVQAANCDRSNLSFTNLCLASLSVIDGNGTSVDIGTFYSDGTSYSGDVASSVDQVTVYAAAMAEELTTVSILPSDSHTDSGHQVRLNHGTNLISISVISGFSDGGIKTYSVAINRAGSAPNNDEVTEVSISGLEWAKEGHTMPFLLTRTGDTTQALTVPVDVSETGGDMVSSSLEGRFDVNFQAGYASARHDLETNADTVWEEHSTVTVAPVDGTGYDVSGSAGVASAEMRDNDFPAATAVLTVDSTEVEEGEEVTATITVTTDAARKPHGYGGDLKLKTEFSAGPGAAESEDVVFRGINDGHKAVSEPSFKPVMTGGVITAYESVYSASITIVDDETWEEAETFNVVMEIRESAGALTSDALKLDTTSTPHMVTIAAHEEDLPVQQSPMSHITVVTEDFGDSGTTFTITWEDVDDCSTVYSAILGTVGKFSDGSGNSALVYNLGRVTSDATQITKSLPEVQDLGSGFTVSLYCADGGSYVHQLVAKVSIPPTTQESSERPLPGTYSTEPAADRADRQPRNAKSRFQQRLLHLCRPRRHLRQ